MRVSTQKWKELVENLERLGFKSYRDYLRSTVWLTIKIRANTSREFSKGCYLCGGKSEAWHHLSYKNLGNEVAGEDIVRVCKEHHNAIHSFDDSGKTKESTVYLKRLYAGADYLTKNELDIDTGDGLKTGTMDFKTMKELRRLSESWRKKGWL